MKNKYNIYKENKMKEYTKEIILHTNLSDKLNEEHKLKNKAIYCDHCKNEMLHASNNECMQTWFETEFGNYCTICFKINETMEFLEENLINRR